MKTIGGSLLLVTCIGALVYFCCDWLMGWLAALPLR